LLKNIGQHSQRAATKLHVRSALNPMLWLTGIATPLCFVSAYALKDSSPVFQVLVFVGLLPMLITCLGFCYFALFKPEKLQSEDYQIRHESLQLIQQKGGHIDIPSVSLEQIVNPGIQSNSSIGGQA